MSRLAPEYVGAVAVYSPTASSVYYRMKWTEPDGAPGDTSAGKTLDEARVKAGEINDRLAMATGPQAVTTLADMVRIYVSEAKSPYKDRNPWKSSYRNQIEDQLNRSIRGFEDYRAMDMDRQLCDLMRAQAGTRTMVRQNTSALRGFLHWGFGTNPQYFTASQADLLPRAVVMPNPSIRGTEQPKRRTRPRAQGQDKEYVGPEDAPGREQVISLGEEIQNGAAKPVGIRSDGSTFFKKLSREDRNRAGHAWGRLAVELAANCGPRWGEQYQLVAPDVHLNGCPAHVRPHLHIDWQVDAGCGAAEAAQRPEGRRCPPKGDKTRIVPIPEDSFTGYALREELADRVAAAVAEQAAGRNKEALLFPDPNGRMWWYSEFEAEVLLPAMRRAGWPLQGWVEVKDEWCKETRIYKRVERERVQARLPWHSLRHRFARVWIDVHGAGISALMAVGGWDNQATVYNRYYKSGKEHLDQAFALLTS